MELLRLPALAVVALLAVSLPGSSALGQSTPVGLDLELDVAALRTGPFATLAEYGYLALVAAVEGTLTTRDAPAVVVTHLRCRSAALESLSCVVDGEFASTLEPTLRARTGVRRGAIPLSPAPRAEPGSILAPASSTWSGLPCSARRWIVSRGAGPHAACDGRETPSPGDRVASVELRGAMIPPALAASALDRVVVTLPRGTEPAIRIVYDHADEGGATRFATEFEQTMRSGDRFAANETIEFRAVRRDGDRVTVDGLLHLDTALERVLHPAPSEVPWSAAEPFAELDDYEARTARTWDQHAFRTNGDASTSAMPIVVVAGTSWSLRDAASEALIDAFGRIWIVQPDAHTPIWAFVWTEFGDEAAEYVNASLRSANRSVDPCALGCVLVGTGDAAELAIELAARDPQRFRGVVTYGAERNFAWDALATIERAPSGVAVEFVPRTRREAFEIDETDHFVARWNAVARTRVAASTTPLADTVRRVLAAERASPRAGRVLDVPRVGSPACRASSGSDDACAAAPSPENLGLRCRAGHRSGCRELNDLLDRRDEAAAAVDDPIANRRGERLEMIACVRGDAESCARLAERHDDPRPISRTYRALFLRRGCDLGSGSACSALGFAFYEGDAVPPSRYEEALYYALGCSAGDATACSNTWVVTNDFDGARLDATRRTTLTSAFCRAGLARFCLDVPASADDELRTFASSRVRRACLEGDAGICAGWAERGVPDPDVAAVAEVRCALDPRTCAAPSPDADRAAVRARLVAASQTSCTAGDRFACVRVGELLEGDAAAIGQRRRAFEAACRAGESVVCMDALETGETPRDREILEIACGFTIQDACDRLPEADAEEAR